MKKQTFYLMAICLSLSFQPLIGIAASKAVVTSSSFSDSLQAQKLLNRLYEINDMDKTNLTRSEKKALKKEVTSIHSGLKDIGKGVYLSVGAIIIILLILILLT